MDILADIFNKNRSSQVFYNENSLHDMSTDYIVENGILKIMWEGDSAYYEKVPIAISGDTFTIVVGGCVCFSPNYTSLKLNRVKIGKISPENMFYNIKSSNFASVFHGIRFKVRRLFVVTTSNFFYA